mgnify:CR=1 FL=1
MAKNGNNGDDNASESIDGTGVLKQIYQRYNNNTAFNSKSTMSDPSDAFSNNFFLGFYHVASKNSVRFMAYLTDYNENYDVNTTPTDVYGRADPIQTYRSTQRNISVSFSIPARDRSEAVENVNRLATLIKFLYPAYKPIPHVVGSENGENPPPPLKYFSSATTLSKPPLIRMKYANIISNNITSQQSSAKNSGLLGFITSMNHTFDLEHGGFDTVGENGAPFILPKMISVPITFKPIHEHPIGWTSDDNLWIGTSDQHKVYEPDQGPRDLDINESELPTFPFGIGPTMLDIPAPVAEVKELGGADVPGSTETTTVTAPESPVTGKDPFAPIIPATPPGE